MGFLETLLKAAIVTAASDLIDATNDSNDEIVENESYSSTDSEEYHYHSINYDNF